MEQTTQATPEVKMPPNENVLALHETGFDIIMSATDRVTNPEKGMFSLAKNQEAVSTAIDALNNYITIGNRMWLESNFLFKQIIPYCAIVKETISDNGETALQYLTYQRAKGSGEERLLGKRSIGIGGHVGVDSFLESYSRSYQVNLLETIHMAAIKELNEEVQFNNGDADEGLLSLPIGILYNEQDDVSMVHVGIAAVVLAKENTVVTSREDALEIGEWLTANQILSLGNNEQWTIDFLSNEEDTLNVINNFRMFQAAEELKQLAALTASGEAKMFDDTLVATNDTEYDAQKETDAQQAEASGLTNTSEQFVGIDADTTTSFAHSVTPINTGVVVETALVDNAETFVNVSAATSTDNSDKVGRGLTNPIFIDVDNSTQFETQQSSQQTDTNVSNN